jgi:hypothetical protein
MHAAGRLHDVRFKHLFAPALVEVRRAREVVDQVPGDVADQTDDLRRGVGIVCRLSEDYAIQILEVAVSAIDALRKLFLDLLDPPGIRGFCYLCLLFLFLTLPPPAFSQIEGYVPLTEDQTVAGNIFCRDLSASDLDNLVLDLPRIAGTVRPNITRFGGVNCAHASTIA